MADCSLARHPFQVLTFRQFTTVGASPHARRKRLIVLGTELALQIGLFFLAAFQVIWLREIVRDHLNDDPMHTQGGAGKGYEVMLALITGLVPAWGLCGWVALRRDKSWLVVPFLVGSAGLMWVAHQKFITGSLLALLTRICHRDSAHTAWLETRPVYLAQATDWGFINFLGIVGAVGVSS